MRSDPLWMLLGGLLLAHGSIACAARRLPVPAGQSEDSEVVASAEAIAAGRLPPRGRLDCSGFVLAAYRNAGKPLTIPDRFASRGGSEAGMLLAWAEAERRVVAAPRPGDLAFFRDTFGPRDGRITHVALVERVDGDGEVELIHVLGSGVSRSRMNVQRPSDPAMNSWLRKRTGSRDSAPKLAGQLFVAYARFD